MTSRTLEGRVRTHAPARRAVSHPAAPIRRAAVAAAAEALEGRRLLSADAPTFVAIADFSTSSANKTNKGVSYYDVSSLATSPGTQTGVFAQAPAFTIWMGYEGTDGPIAALKRNAEEISAFTVNPMNGDTYLLAFDSGPQNTSDEVGDTQGDYDLYRYNFAIAYNDYTARQAAYLANPSTVPNPRGLMYTDIIAPDGFNYQTRYAAGGYAVDGADAGIPLARSNKDADKTNDIAFLDGLVDKVGEIARIQSTGSRFFGETNADTNGDNEGGQDIQFVDPNTLILAEQSNLETATPANTLDYSVKVIKRTSLTPGAAPGSQAVTVTASTQDFVGGTNPVVPATAAYAEAPAGTPLTSESWISQTIDTDPTAADSGGLYYNMDLPAVQSNADGLRYVEQDGVKGVWISDRKPTSVTGTTPIGGEFAFWELDLGPTAAPSTTPFAPTATKRQLTLAADPANPAPLTVDTFKLAEDPQANARTADGELDWFDVDENGDLIIAEKDSSDTPAGEPGLVTLDVQNYNLPIVPPVPTPVSLGTFTTHPSFAPTIDDDALVTDSRFGVFERGQNYAYYFDQDASSAPQDVYVYDLDTNTLVYQELDATNHGMDDANQIRTFTLGDYANAAGPVTRANDVDGIAGASDIDALFDRVADPTAGGAYPASVGAELFDLSGDNTLSTVDVDTLVRKVFGTQYGDLNLDGEVGPGDFNILATNFSLAGGWAKGDITGDDSVGPGDFNILATFFGFIAPTPPPPPSPIIAAAGPTPVTKTVVKLPPASTTTRVPPRTTTTAPATISTSARSNAITRSLRA